MNTENKGNKKMNIDKQLDRLGNVVFENTPIGGKRDGVTVKVNLSDLDDLICYVNQCNIIFNKIEVLRGNVNSF